METTLYKVIFPNGQMFKVFCANKAQKARFHESIRTMKKYPALVTVLENGIHDIKQWEGISSSM